MIRGFDIAVKNMRVGQKGSVWIRSDYAYGKIGQPPTILNDEDLIFNVEVISAKDVDTGSLSILNDEQRVERAKETKLRANEAFKAGKLDDALDLYKEAANYVSKLAQYTAET